MWLMAYVSLSENCRHLSSIFLWQPKFDEHCDIVNRNICHLAIAPKLLSLVLMCLDIFLVLPKLDSGLEMCLWLLRKAHVHIFYVWIALTMELTRSRRGERRRNLLLLGTHTHFSTMDIFLIGETAYKPISKAGVVYLRAFFYFLFRSHSDLAPVPRFSGLCPLVSWKLITDRVYDCLF